MKTAFILFPFALCLFCHCSKEQITMNEKDKQVIATLSFNSTNELADYAKLISEQSGVASTKANNRENGFVSLWDSKRAEVLSSLTDTDLAFAESEGLYYEPEDEIIPDPVFAKILNPQREVKVNGLIYRYVSNGVIVYDEHSDMDIIESVSLEEYDQLQEKEEIEIDEGIRFIRLHYQVPIDCDTLLTKSPILEPGLYSDRLVLNDGISVPRADVRVISYGSEGDANWVQRTISSIFGTNVVATNYFDSSHRMKLRTFSQDFVVYTTVGMTVRMQQKSVGIWWRKKAQEFRYGWTAVECYYTYKGPSFPSGVTTNFQNANVLLHNHMNYYEKPLLLFSIPIVDYSVTNKTISTLLKSLLQKNQKRINTWLNNYPDYKDNPYSFFSADKQLSYSMIYPQYEEHATNDGREQVNWDLRPHFQIGIRVGGGEIKPVFSPVEDPEKIEIRRGEVYAAVKYDNKWKACVISI